MSQNRAAFPLLICLVLLLDLGLTSVWAPADAQFFPRQDDQSDAVRAEREVDEAPSVPVEITPPQNNRLPWLRRSARDRVETDDRLIFRRSERGGGSVEPTTVRRNRTTRRSAFDDEFDRSDRANSDANPRRGNQGIEAPRTNRFGRSRRDDERQDTDQDAGLAEASVQSEGPAFGLPEEPSRPNRTRRTGSTLPERRNPEVQQPVGRLEPPDIQPSLTAAQIAADNDLDPVTTGSLSSDDSEDEGLGINVGSFRLFPALELRGGGSLDTGNSLQQESGSGFGTIAPELSFRSIWTRHSLEGDLRGSLTRFTDDDAEDDWDVDARIEGQLDIGARSSLTVEGTYALERVPGGDVSAPDNAEERPLLQSAGLSATAEHTWNRVTASLRGSVTAFFYGDARDENGASVDNSGLNNRVDEGELRLSYEYSPKTEVFIEGEIDHNVYDEGDQGSTGQRVQVGAIWRPSALLELSASIGADRRDPDADGADVVTGLAANGSIVWAPSALTTVTLSGRRELDITNEPGAAAVTVTGADLSIEHDLTRFITLRGGLAYELSEFEGLDRDDHRLSANAGLTYELNRYVLFVADLTYLEIDSSDPDEDSQDTEYSAGVRIRY